MQKPAISMAIVVLFGAMMIGTAMAGPSQVYFDEYNDVMIELSPIGNLLGSDLLLLAKVNLSDPDNSLGLGFSGYNQAWNELGLTIFANDVWYAHGYYCYWAGNGTLCQIASTSGYYGQEYLYTSPPVASAPKSEDPNRR